jgi:hypothetical protein
MTEPHTQRELEIAADLLLDADPDPDADDEPDPPF